MVGKTEFNIDCSKYWPKPKRKPLTVAHEKPRIADQIFIKVIDWRERPNLHEGRLDHER